MSDLVSSITNYLDRLETPSNYSLGLVHKSCGLPENVLLSQRVRGNVSGRLIENIHHRFLIVFPLKSDGTAIINSNRFRLKVGTGIVIFPHQFHYFIHDNSTINWAMLGFEMKEYEHYEILRDKVFNVSDQCMKWIGDLSRSVYLNQTEKLETQLDCALITGLILQEILRTELIPHVSPTLVSAHDKVVDSINSYIYTNIEEQLSVSMIADHFNYSESHLRLLYRKAMGISIGDYMKSIKMRLAQKLLVTTNKKVSEISIICGYNSVYAFSRAFKNYSEVSPKEYRNRYKY